MYNKTFPSCLHLSGLPLCFLLFFADIDKEELYRMFKAYFYLSMEAVREAVKVIEEELILNYNDNTTNPVSAAFVGLPDSETMEGASTACDLLLSVLGSILMQSSCPACTTRTHHKATR